MKGDPALVRHALTPALMVFYFYIMQSRQVLLAFKSAASLWRQDRWKPIVAGAVNLETWKMIMLYLVYLSIRAYLDMTDNVKVLMKGLAAFAIWNFLLVVKDHISGVYQPHGVFPHQNCLAMGMHLFAGMFFASYLAGGWRKSFLNIAAFVASTACIVRTYSRGAIALIPITFFVTFVLSFVGSAKGACMRLFRKAFVLFAIFVAR